MNKITDHLYLGNFDDGNTDSHELMAMGITAVLNVGYELWPEYEYFPDEVRYVKIGLLDSMDNPPSVKRLAVDTLKALLNSGETVLCHCAMGASRSVYVVVCALAEMSNKSYHQVFEEIKKERPIVMWGPLFAYM